MSWMQGELLEELSDEKVVVGGDGQCDSPGFMAKNLCYFLVEVTSGYILEVEVRDKRHIGLAFYEYGEGCAAECSDQTPGSA